MNTVNKAWIQGRDLPVLIVMNHDTFLDDPDETEYLAVPSEMNKYGATVYLAPRNLGGDGRLFMLMKNIFHFGGIMKVYTLM